VPGAGGWLDSDQTALQLLGAGWSLTTEKNQQKRAAETLDQLAGDLDPRIRNLATAQLWRLRTRLSPKQIKQWERIVAGMESENRAGAMPSIDVGSSQPVPNCVSVKVDHSRSNQTKKLPTTRFVLCRTKPTLPRVILGSTGNVRHGQKLINSLANCLIGNQHEIFRHV